jgi:hypothetical protein
MDASNPEGSEARQAFVSSWLLCLGEKRHRKLS